VEKAVSEISKSDRRLYPRKGCELVDRTQGHTVRNISMGGLYLESPTAYQKDQTVHLNIDIPNAGNIHPVGNVVRVEDAGSEQHHYGISWAKLSGKDRKVLKRYLLNVIKKDELSELRDRFLSSNKANVVEVTEHFRVRSLLKGAKDSHCSLVIFQDGSYEGYVEGQIFEVDEELLKIKIKETTVLDNLSFTKPFSIYFDYSFHGYFLEARLDATPKGELHFRIPKIIYYTDKRNDPRLPVTDGTIEFPIPYPRGAHFKAKLMDISQGGASFTTPMEGWYFLPGTPIKEIKLKINSGERSEENAEVRYLVPHEDNLFRIGVEFSRAARGNISVDRQEVKSEKTWASPMKNLYQKLRVGTHLFISKQKSKVKAKEAKSNLVNVARYKNAQGHEIVALINSSVPLNGKQLRAPVVIIPAAYGKKKETTAGLALTITEHFKKRGLPVVVIRFDFTNALGESYKDETSRGEGRSNLNLSPVTCSGDILSTIDFAQSNPQFAATDTIMVSISYTSPMARHAIMNDRRQRVSYWINLSGTPHMQELIKNASGGIDYVGNVQKGMNTGMINFLGEMLDGTKFCRDAIAERMAFIKEAREDLSALKIPVSWIYGKYDSWVNPEAIRDVMSIKSSAKREVIEVPTGHLPTSSEEAFGNFRLVTKLIANHIEKEPTEVKDPDMTLVVDVMARERNRLPKQDLNEKGYWKTYLVGEKEKDLGIDVLAMTDDYREMMAKQIDLLDIQPGETIVDAGTGTGNFAGCLATYEKGRSRLDKNTILMADFIPEAIDRARIKAENLKSLVPSLKVDSCVVDLELSRLLPFIRFHRGEYYGLEEMKGRVAGIPSFIFDKWIENYDASFHRILRGKEITDADIQYLENKLSPSDVELALEFNQASQLAGLFLEKKDPAVIREAFSNLRFEKIELGRDLFNFSYPLQAGSADKILMSIVLSYIFNPQEVVNELYRILKPGGRIVLSSFRPDADMTISYSKMISKIEKLKDSPVPGYNKEELLQAVRDYANTAATLLRYGEEGLFALFGEEELKNMLQFAGFQDIVLIKTFGEPSQVIVSTATKPITRDQNGN
jgi:ubiquinone/menaquinone biosynthesis C-methylase UbiE